ncbi:MAG TPA: hypothetical protein VLV89_09585 [Candidatus Acidoferrum sp.]|nr:hypothetical protein [Candidatus Acidoferrum sp.]
MKGSTLLGLSLCLAIGAIPAISQQNTPGAVHTQIEGIQITPIGDAPFTAKEAVTWNQPQVGGGTVSLKYYTMVARDSQGRVHRENREFIPGNSTEEPPLRTFTIQDPVAGVSTTCTKATMTCATSAFNATLALAQNATNQAKGSSKSLGQQTIEGLTTTGTQQTASKVSGPHGSTLAVSQTESWFSTDLQIDLSVTRTNPQSGVVTLNVTELVRGEPDPSWFTIPAGYTVLGGKTQ